MFNLPVFFMSSEKLKKKVVWGHFWIGTRKLNYEQKLLNYQMYICLAYERFKLQIVPLHITINMVNL